MEGSSKKRKPAASEEENWKKPKEEVKEEVMDNANSALVALQVHGSDSEEELLVPPIIPHGRSPSAVADKSAEPPSDELLESRNTTPTRSRTRLHKNRTPRVLSL